MNIIADFGRIKYILSDTIALINRLNKDNGNILVSYFFLSLHWHKIYLEKNSFVRRDISETIFL